MDAEVIYILIPLLPGWIADRCLGDPSCLPHPVAGFGKVISYGEKKLNKGRCRMLKGAILSILLIVLCYFVMWLLIYICSAIHPVVSVILSGIVVFFCLAGKTLIDEVKLVFVETGKSAECGRKQLARIVGRDTSALSPQQIRVAALETLSENLSDGVIAPLFWFALLGVPGMFAYKMVNTLDSMIGYKNERYRQFGCWAARIDDVANYIPARLTAFLMILVSGKTNFLALLAFVRKYASCHLSPNSGYPEAALAGILNCKFGGPNFYFGKIVEKKYIGENARDLGMADLNISVAINRRTEVFMLIIVICIVLISYYFNL